MSDSTRITIGITRFLVLGVAIVAPLAGAAYVFSNAQQLLKPIAQVYQIDLGQNGGGAASGGGGSASSSPSPQSTVLPQRSLPAPSLDQLAAQLSKNAPRDLQQTMKALRQQLDETEGQSYRVPAGAGSATASEIEALRRELQQCQAQIRSLSEALQRQVELSKRAAKPAAAVARVARPAKASPAGPSDPELRQQQYAEAVRLKNLAEAALERVKANPKHTQEQVFAAAYDLMQRRAVVTRLEPRPAQGPVIPGVPVASVAE